MDFREIKPMVQIDKSIHELDTVALKQDWPEQGLFAGEVGTVLVTQRAGLFLVEFANSNGESTNILSIEENMLIKLQYLDREEMTYEPNKK